MGVHITLHLGKWVGDNIGIANTDLDGAIIGITADRGLGALGGLLEGIAGAISSFAVCVTAVRGCAITAGICLVGIILRFLRLGGFGGLGGLITGRNSNSCAGEQGGEGKDRELHVGWLVRSFRAEVASAKIGSEELLMAGCFLERWLFSYPSIQETCGAFIYIDWKTSKDQVIQRHKPRAHPARSKTQTLCARQSANTAQGTGSPELARFELKGDKRRTTIR